MCGGRGTRLGGEREKPLVRVCGTPMIDGVLDALDASGVEAVHAVTSPDAPETRAHVADREGVAVVDAPGDGYVADLSRALSTVGRPAVTVAADLPLLPAEAVDRAVDAACTGGDGRVDEAEAAPPRSVTVCVPTALKRRLGASVDAAFERDGAELAPTGLNVVGPADRDAETTLTTYDARLAVNVNRPSDLELAAALCERT